jgi:hypothetical protein
MSALLVVFSAFGAFAALIVAGLRCHDRCDEAGDEWHQHVDAWQWEAQFGVAGLGLAAVCVACWLAAERRYRRASATMAISAASWGFWAALLAPASDGLL